MTMAVAAGIAARASTHFTSSNGFRAIILAGVWVAAIVGVDFGLRFALQRYETRLAERDAKVAARRRTTFSLLRRVVTVVLILIGTWSVLSIFPATAGAAKAFLASSAAVGLILGLALTTPLGNLGSGILLMLIQPARFGDRITVDIRSGQRHTGTVEKMSLAYTTLVTDEGRQIFIPNLMLVRNVIVNHSRGDRRRALSVRLPVAVDAAIDDARHVAFESAREVEEEGDHEFELHVNVTEVTERAIWLEITGFAPADADVTDIETNIRKRALLALRSEELLASQGTTEHRRQAERVEANRRNPG
ncbi:MAG: mechanosensitive ion channel family protein [Acidimicrobiaceae bacterium]|nr:mechanosensitive ion channel family protein [Acidimicrobiaceae bacterium]